MTNGDPMTGGGRVGGGPQRLVTVAHGTRKQVGNLVAREVTAAAAARLGLESVTSYVELSEPLFEDVVAASAAPTLVVPLLLSTGFHLRQDLPRMVGGAGGPVRLGRSLGPHALLADAQVERLLAAGARPGQPLTMVAAGSTDPLATRDLVRATDLLARAWGGEVRLGTLSGLGSRIPDVVRRGDAVTPYLLADGFFAGRLRAEALAAGASLVADVIGPHRLVVDLVVRRVGALVAAADVARTGHPAARGG